MAKSVTTVGVHEAKTHLSRLLERVAAGEDIVITRRGEVVARIVADGPSTRRRRLGAAAHEGPIPEEFYEPLPDEILRYFE
jgi:prevent-host-death family protein